MVTLTTPYELGVLTAQYCDEDSALLECPYFEGEDAYNEFWNGYYFALDNAEVLV